ncbi:MAG: hypothetical protein HYZ29_19905 [Myxococcales bacterium]|nr:hypothetical protein [Myxococcales bacterium]
MRCFVAIALTLLACASEDGGTAANTGGTAGGGAGGSIGDAGWPDASSGGASSGGSSGSASGGMPSGGSGGTTPTGQCTRLGPWKQTAAFADGSHVSHPLPSFGVGGRYYVHTMASGGGERVLRFAQQASDGSLGAWQTASPDHGGGPHGFTAIVVNGEPYHFRNGHIARYPLDASGKMTGDVVLLESNPDAAFGGNRYVWDSALVATVSGKSWVIHLGGFSFTGYTYKPNVYRNAVPLQPAFTAAGLDHPAQRPGKNAFWAPFIFTGEGDGGKIWRTQVAADGKLDPWTALGSLPAGTDNQRGDWFVIDGTLFVVRGAKVLAAKIDAQGSLGAFVEQPALSEPQIDLHWGDGHLEGSSHAVLGNFVYVTGKKTVHFAPVLKNQPCTP